LNLAFEQYFKFFLRERKEAYMKKIRLNTTGFMVIVTSLILMVTGAYAADESIPNKPLIFVVPFGTGGGTDLTARLLAPELQKELGVPVQVVNKAGGGGWVAWTEMAKWKPDDWMIGYVNLPHIFGYLNPKMKRSETVASYNFLFLHTVDPGMILVKEGDTRFPNLKAFIDYAMKNKTIVAAHGFGGDDFIGVKQVEKAFPGIKINMVHNKSDSKSISQLVGGHVDAIFGNVAAYTPQILEGTFRPLAVNWYERVKFVPSVPTFEELTGKKVIHYAGRTVAGPPGMPKARVEAITNAFERAVKNPAYQLKMLNSNLSIDVMKGDKLNDFLKDSEEMVKKIAYWEEQ
jgi:tripartite-type tricarboxylate transporter receptor subunit TctC